MKDIELEGIDVKKIMEIKQLCEPRELKIIENSFLPDNVVVVSTKMMKALKLPKVGKQDYSTNLLRGNIIPEK